MSKIAVVAGAGSGVGRAVVVELAKRGYQVALLGRRLDPLEETIKLAGGGAGGIPGGNGRSLSAIPCDISREQDVAAMCGRVRAEFGPPSVLVNSAGTNVARRSLAELSVADWHHVVDVDLTGAFLVTHAFLSDMRKAGRGTIVHVVSDAGLTANRVSGAAYVASKFGLVGFTGTINAEERRNGIRACAVCPGEINTPLLDRRPVPPPQEARLKMLQPEDVAACVMLAIDLPDRATVEQLLVRPREA